MIGVLHMGWCVLHSDVAMIVESSRMTTHKAATARGVVMSDGNIVDTSGDEFLTILEMALDEADRNCALPFAVEEAWYAYKNAKGLN